MGELQTIKYSYQGVPTLQRFAQSDAFFRGVMGPFGCTSADTEYLSRFGWRRIDEYDGGPIAQWHPATGQIEFVTPEAYIVEPCDELIEFDSGSLVMRLSPEHRVPHYNWAGRFAVKSAADIERRPSKRTIPTTFGLGKTSGIAMSDDEIRFAVMMHADGHYPRQGKKAQVCVRKDRKKIRARQILDAIGLAFEERVYPSRPSETTFRFEPPYFGKQYSGWWWKASKHQLGVILDEMSHWDGLADHVETRFFSVNKCDADFMQYAAHATGRRATIKRTDYPKNPKWRPTYAVYIRAGDNPKNRAMVRVDTTDIRRVPTTDGKKYCFTVPSGCFVARCDDTVFITGNSGKSSACVTELINRARAQPRSADGVRHSRWAVVRNTYGELRDTTIRTVHQWLPPQHFGKHVEQRHSYEIKAIPGCDIELIFLALDRPDDIKKLLSLELTGGWVNEAREVPWSIIEALMGRLGRYPRRQDVGDYWYGLWADTNPPDSESPWYSYFEDRKWLKDFNEMRRSGALPASMRPEDFVAIFKQPGGLEGGAENLHNLPGGRGYYQKLSIGKTQEWIKVYVDGQYGFVMEGKLIYSDYVDGVHCRDIDPIPDVPVLRGWDFGLTPACVFTQLLPDGRFLVFDEMTSDNMSVDKFGDEVIEHSNRAFRGRAEFIDVGDPSGDNRAETDARSAFDILQAKDIDIRGAMTNDPRMRQEAVGKTLRTMTSGEPQFVLHSRCRVLRRGFLGGYHRKRLQTGGPERYTEKADKNRFSHPHDALQYAALEYFGPSLVVAPRDDNDEFFDAGYANAFDGDRDDVTGY